MHSKTTYLIGKDRKHVLYQLAIHQIFAFTKLQKLDQSGCFGKKTHTKNTLHTFEDSFQLVETLFKHNQTFFAAFRISL